MKRFLLLASLAAVAVGGVAAIPANAGAAKVKCKLVGKKSVKCPAGKLRGPQGPAGPAGEAGAAGDGAGANRFALFMQAGDAHAEFLTVEGAVAEANCEDPGGDFQNTNLQGTSVDDGYASVRGVDTAGNGASDDDEDFNTGDDVELDGGNFDGTFNLLYTAGPGAEILRATYAIEDGDPMGNQFDCIIVGDYVTV